MKGRDSEGSGKPSFALNGLSIDQISINQDGELRVAFDLPVVQTTARYHQQLQGVRTFDVYRYPELVRLSRDLFRAIRARVEEPDPDLLAARCVRCKTEDGRVEKCVFLKESPGGQMRCSVYDHRPEICRDFDELSCDDFEPLA